MQGKLQQIILTLALTLTGMSPLALAKDNHRTEECPDLRGTYSCSFLNSNGEFVTEKIQLNQKQTRAGVLYLMEPNLDYDLLEANGQPVQGEEFLEDNDLLLKSHWERTLSCREGKLYTQMKYTDFVDDELIGYNQLNFSVRASAEGLHIEGESLWQDSTGKLILEESFSEVCPRLEN